MSCNQEMIRQVVSKVRTKRPLVHHITNFVTMNGVANITLCMGALPVMAHAAEEVEEMVESASALVLNIGTLWPGQIDAMILAGLRANKLGIPIVLDPVGVGATRLRNSSARRLMEELSFSVIRGNAAEIATLAGVDARMSGVESVSVAGDSTATAGQLARQQRCVVVITGAIDVVTDGFRLVRISNGHPMMAAVTGTGCMATAVIGACTAAESDTVSAAAAALACYGLAGEHAAARSQGPGTFQAKLFDALAEIVAESVAEPRTFSVEETVL